MARTCELRVGRLIARKDLLPAPSWEEGEWREETPRCLQKWTNRKGVASGRDHGTTAFRTTQSRGGSVPATLCLKFIDFLAECFVFLLQLEQLCFDLVEIFG